MIFEDRIRECYTALLDYALRCGLEDDDLQEAFYTALEKERDLRDRSKFFWWMCRIIKNKANDRRKKKQPLLLSEDMLDLPMWSREEGRDLDVRAVIERLVEGMPHYADLVTSFIENDGDCRDMAADCGKSNDSIRKRKERFTKCIKQLICDMRVSPDDVAFLAPLFKPLNDSDVGSLARILRNPVHIYHTTLVGGWKPEWNVTTIRLDGHELIGFNHRYKRRFHLEAVCNDDGFLLLGEAAAGCSDRLVSHLNFAEGEGKWRGFTELLKGRRETLASRQYISKELLVERQVRIRFGNAGIE